MSDLNMQIVREFFELHLFHVLTHWQHGGVRGVGDPSSLLFVEHTRPGSGAAPDFLLQSGAVAGLSRAVVEVRAWHTDRFYPSVIENSPGLAHIASEETAQMAQVVFGNAPFSTLLVISRLPQSAEPRQRTLELLQQRGIDHVIEFPTILQDILQGISAHGNYAPSQTLQTMRLLKRYNFIRRQQMEFAFSKNPPPPTTPLQVETTAPVDEENEED